MAGGLEHPLEGDLAWVAEALVHLDQAGEVLSSVLLIEGQEEHLMVVIILGSLELNKPTVQACP